MFIVKFLWQGDPNDPDDWDIFDSVVSHTDEVVGPVSMPIVLTRLEPESIEVTVKVDAPTEVEAFGRALSMGPTTTQMVLDMVRGV